MATYRLQKIFRQEASDAALEALRADKILRLQEARAEEKRRKEENRAKLLKGAAIGAATLGGLYAANKGWLGKGMCSLTRSGINLVTGKTDQAKKEWGRVGKGFQRDWREIFGYPTKPAVQQTQNQAPATGASQQNQGVQTPVVPAQGSGNQNPTPPANGGITQNPTPPVAPPPATDTSVNPTPPANTGSNTQVSTQQAPVTDTPANGGTTQVATQGNTRANNRGGRRNSGQGNNRGSRGRGTSKGSKGKGSQVSSSGITYTIPKTDATNYYVPGGISYS